jgi:small subunit ribosomal protein S16
MSVKLRLLRRGRKKLALFDIVVADARSPRDGRYIQKIGTYNPNSNPASIEIDSEKTIDWLIKGAQPTDTVRRILSYKGIMMRKHLQVGVSKSAITQEEADRRYEAWLQEKEGKISGKKADLAKTKAESEKARLEAERKIKEAREEALRQKRIVASAELEGAALEAASGAAEAIAEIEGTPAAPEEAETVVAGEESPVLPEAEADSKSEAPAEVADESPTTPAAAADEVAEAPAEVEEKSAVETAPEASSDRKPQVDAPESTGTAEEEK